MSLTIAKMIGTRTTFLPYVAVAILGAALFVFYWWGIERGLQLADEKAEPPSPHAPSPPALPKTSKPITVAPQGTHLTEPHAKDSDSFLQSLTTEELHSLGKNRLMALMKARQAIRDWEISMEDRMSMVTGEDHDFLLKQRQQGPPQKLKDACKQAVAEYRSVRTLILEKSGPNEDTQEILKETGNAKCE